MKKFAIVFIKDGEFGTKGSIGAVYSAASPNPGGYSRDFADPSITKHVEIPEGYETDQSVLKATVEDDGDVVLSEDSAAKTALAAARAREQVRALVRGAREFGNKMIEEFTIDNVMLGITHDDKTDEVLDKMKDLILSLQSGSLYLAREQAISFPDSKKITKYITDARLLSLVNKIETYLGIPLTDEL